MLHELRSEGVTFPSISAWFNVLSIIEVGCGRLMMRVLAAHGIGKHQSLHVDVGHIDYLQNDWQSLK